MFTSSHHSFLLFGLNDAFGTAMLLDAGKIPFPSPTKLHFGAPLDSYQLISLLNEKYVLAVGFKNDEYTVSVFELTRSVVTPLLNIVSKNHPNGNPADDAFMKSIDISYNQATNFLTLYDRGEGQCTQYFLGKKEMTSPKALIDFIDETGLFKMLK